MLPFGADFCERCAIGRRLTQGHANRPSLLVVNFLLLLLLLLLCDAFTAPDQWAVLPAQSSAFLHASDVVSVTVGDNAMLGCQIDHNKKYKVLWTFKSNTLTFNEKTVTTDKRFYVRRVPHSKDIWDLGIRGVHEGDAGNYSCIINTSPPQRRVVRLVVKVPPRITSAQLQQLETVAEEAHLQVDCKAAGKPEPSVRWMKEDKEGQMQPIDFLQTGSDLFVHGTDLIISSARRWMEGTYVCIAENGLYPPARKTLTLTVQFRPVVKFVNSRLGQQLGGITMLQCKVEASPPSQVHWKFNGSPLDPEPKPCTTISTGQRICKDIYVQDTTHNTQKAQVDLTIRNVTAVDYGTYACVANSALGVSQALAELYKIVPDDEPYISRRYQNDENKGRRKQTATPRVDTRPTRPPPSSTRVSVISSANSRGPGGHSSPRVSPSRILVTLLVAFGLSLLPFLRP